MLCDGFSLIEINTTDPAIPIINPSIFLKVITSFKSHAAINVMKIGQANISNEACIGIVRDNPFMKNV